MDIKQFNLKNNIKSNIAKRYFYFCFISLPKNGYYCLPSFYKCHIEYDFGIQSPIPEKWKAEKLDKK